ncbi:MAG: PEP/pyruvate-binding domain-containing protein [Candidatus Sericytochromatia bacterium]
MIRFLDTLNAKDVATAGGKAATLGAMAKAGLPVPPGFCVTTGAYLEAASAPEVAEAIQAATAATPAEAAATIAPLFQSAPLPPDVEASVRAAYGELARRMGVEQPAVAVRSSALGEDGAGASFAGQHATFLNASGEEAVLLAIKACWAGLWSERAIGYRRRFAAQQAPAIAVLVQALVVPEAAGVAFTADPVTGDRGAIAIDASWGLGEAVVSGRATPDAVLVDKLTGDVRRYVIGAKEVEVVPEGGGVTCREVPEPRRQARCLAGPAIASLHALAIAAEAHAGCPQDLEWAWSHGRIFLLQSRPITALPAPPPPDGWESPVAGARFERRNFAEHFPGPVSPLAETLLLPAVGARLHALAREVGHDLPDPALLAIHGYVYARGDMEKHWSLPFCAVRHAWRLLTGNPRRWERGEGHAARVARLPGKPDDRVRWLEAYVASLADAWADLHRLSAGWRWSEYALRRVMGGDMILTGAMLSGFAAPAGTSPASFDPAVPLVTVEDHHPPATVVAQREQAVAEALAQSGWKRPFLAWLIRWAQAYAAVREPALSTLGHGWAAFREQLLLLGGELGLEAPEAIFLLRWDEVQDLAAGGPPPDPALLAERRAMWEEQATYSPPLVVGEATPLGHARALQGIGASGGTVTGPCRVITGPEDFASMRPGEVLVAPATTPAWTPLFHLASAIVTDVGGPLSHGSIVAREFGIPAVLGTEAATRRLRTGEVVTVDGDLGVVWPGGA